jgi:hypothetical protein
LRLSACLRRDAALRIEVLRVFEANFRVYGVREVWRQGSARSSMSPAARSPD